MPFLGLFAAIAYRFERDELRRECPNCGRVTKIYDALCTRCGTELEFPDVAIAPESLGADPPAALDQPLLFGCPKPNSAALTGRWHTLSLR